MDAAPIFKQQPRLALSERASMPLLAGLSVILFVTAVRMFDTVDVDVAWQLWIAGRLNSGAHLYQDIMEVNPPLWFWMAQPIVAASRLVGVSPQSLVVLVMGALSALSIVATNGLLPHIVPRRRALLLAYAGLALMAAPWLHVGQREQIALIGTLPYAALIAARREKMAVPASRALLIGAGAALGYALKHYFLLVPAGLELWLLASVRREWRPLRPETVAMTLVGVLYLFAIAIFARNYLTAMVPLIRLAYGKVGASGLKDVFGPFFILGTALCAFVVAHWRLLSKAPFASALLVAASGFGVAYLIQSKGWNYHTIPLVGCGSIALAALLAETAGPSRLISPSLLALPLFFAVDERVHREEPTTELLHSISGLKRGDSVAFLAVDNALPWSVTLQQGFRYPTRYMAFWMLKAIVQNEQLGDADPRLVQLGRRIVSETVLDWRCIPPAAIIVERPGPNQQGFDILEFFRRDPNFVELLSHYRARPWAGFQRLDQVSPLAPPQRPCRTGV